MDGDHQSVAEAIEDVAILALHQQSRIDQFFARETLAFQGVFQRVPIFRRVTELECFDRPGGNGALGEMLPRRLRCRAVDQQMIEPLRGGGYGFMQSRQVLILNLGFGLMLLNFNADLAAQFTQDLFEFQTVALHDVSEDIAAGVACAEALPRVRLRPHDE